MSSIINSQPHKRWIPHTRRFAYIRKVFTDPKIKIDRLADLLRQLFEI